MSRELIRAIEVLASDFRRADIKLIGRMPPLFTICFPDVAAESQYHNYVLHGTSKETAMVFSREHRSMLRPDTLCSISGIEVRLTSDQRIDEIVRRNFK